MAHASLLESGWLWAAVQEHSYGCKVLQHPLEKRCFTTVDDGILVDTPVHVTCTCASWRCLVTGSGPLGGPRGDPAARPDARGVVHTSGHTVGRVAIPHPERLVEFCQLVVRLALGLGDLIEACMTLSVRGAVARCLLTIHQAASAPDVADKALAREVR